MSRDARDWAWAQETSPTQKLVLLALAEHANGGNECWPSLGRLEERTGLTRRGVRKVLRQLEERGLVTSRCGGGRSASTYSLAVSERHTVPLREEPRSPLGGTPFRSGGNQVPPNRNRTVIEPSLNPKRARARASGVSLPDWIDRSTSVTRRSLPIWLSRAGNCRAMYNGSSRIT